MRFVLRRREFLTTPRLLAKALSARIRIWPSRRLLSPSYTQDLLLTMPPIEALRDTPWNLREAIALSGEFFRKNKFQQRMILKNYFPIPWTCSDLLGVQERMKTNPGEKYVIRRLRHQKGHFYRVADNPETFRPGEEYVSSLFPKRREYRIITVKGHPTVILRKKPQEGASKEDAWNHEFGAHFLTIQDHEHFKLKDTDLFQRIADCYFLQATHLAGLDILANGTDYVVCEINSSPALTLPGNIEKVVDRLGSI